MTLELVEAAVNYPTNPVQTQKCLMHWEWLPCIQTGWGNYLQKEKRRFESKKQIKWNNNRCHICSHTVLSSISCHFWYWCKHSAISLTERPTFCSSQPGLTMQCFSWQSVPVSLGTTWQSCKEIQQCFQYIICLLSHYKRCIHLKKKNDKEVKAFETLVVSEWMSLKFALREHLVVCSL